MTEDYFKANTQLMARCIYNPRTGKAIFEDFSNYYAHTKNNRKLFN